MSSHCPDMGSAESILEHNQFISPCIFVSPYADTITHQLKNPAVGQKLVDLGLFDAPPTDVQVRQLLTGNKQFQPFRRFGMSYAFLIHSRVLFSLLLLADVFKVFPYLSYGSCTQSYYQVAALKFGI